LEEGATLAIKPGLKSNYSKGDEDMDGLSDSAEKLVGDWNKFILDLGKLAKAESIAELLPDKLWSFVGLRTPMNWPITSRNSSTNH